jgi:phosphotriesterase-related protein
MANVNSVLGPISADDLGVTLMHEHLAVAYTGWEFDVKARPYDREALARECVEALKGVKVHGLKTLVDASPIDVSRDPELQKEVSERSEINIICATGMINESMGAAGYLKHRSRMMFDATTELYETFVKEITEGIGDTGVKAGVIKVATGHGSISEYEEMTLKAAARAQKETGVPIISHTEEGTMGPEQADLLIAEGVDPKRIMIGHICGNTDMMYHTSILEKGAYISFDRLGINSEVTDTLRKACIIGLIGIGHANRIMLSHDYVQHWLGREPAMPDFLPTILPDWSYTHVFTNIIPALKEAGVSDDKITTMMVENPRRLFGGRE